jgi:hypothetical protein
MAPKQSLNRMLKFNQRLFDNAFEAAVKLQDQAEKVGNMVMDQAGLLPGDQRQVYHTCLETFKTGRSQFKSFMDENFRQAQQYLV